MNKLFAILSACLMLFACTEVEKSHIDNEKTLTELAYMFKEPSIAYRPYVWWHWMGSNFSKEGITKDLEAMKEAGIGGATIFNLASAVQESHKPIENNPWPEQTYRSKAYWEALVHAASEAERLGLKLGLQNTPGYATTGGPWITEERGMQKIVMSQTAVEGNQELTITLEKPVLPVYEGWGTSNKRATYYQDIAVMAVPHKKGVTSKDIIELSEAMDADGNLQWSVPAGKWTVFRIGHAPTMANPHPLPDELIGKVLEADKMSKEQSIYHLENVLNPLVEHLHPYIGTTFTHILIDSYEAEGQDWTPGFREMFQEQKGYDPLPWIALRAFDEKDGQLNTFNEDYKSVVNRLFIDNGWAVAKEMIHQAGLQFFWEPYTGPFDTKEGTALADLPMGEFWTGGSGAVSSDIVQAAKDAGKRLVGAEAFTGRPEISQYTEDPAFLKHSADGSFHSGANLLFLHHWVHQPFDDRYQPGMGMGWWGTHFGRNQTWFKPGKAFFSYLTRCQLLLQESEYVGIRGNVLHRSRKDAEIYFVINPSKEEVSERFAFPNIGSKPELWDADKGTIRLTDGFEVRGDSIYIHLNFHSDESIFVVFPKEKNDDYKQLVLPAIKVEKETERIIDGSWNVLFEPKLDNAFEREFPALIDFTHYSDPAIKYFAGTATYQKEITVDASSLSANQRILLDAGIMNDIAEVRVNGKPVGVLWYPPYQIDITPFLQIGDNQLEISVTTNWANRLIGDEQHPADFEWGEDRGVAMGRAMKAFPEWFMQPQPRPSKERKAFYIWYYHRKDSPLQPAGLVGPVRLIQQQTAG